jgi:hypothetical protein
MDERTQKLRNCHTGSLVDQKDDGERSPRVDELRCEVDEFGAFACECPISFIQGAFARPVAAAQRFEPSGWDSSFNSKLTFCVHICHG